MVHQTFCCADGWAVVTVPSHKPEDEDTQKDSSWITVVLKYHHWAVVGFRYSMDTASLAYWLRRPPQEQTIPGLNPARARIFSGSSHTGDLKIGTPVATLPGAWHYRVSAGTGWPDVSIVWLGEVESLVCNFCFSVVARKIVWADPSLRYTQMLLGR